MPRLRLAPIALIEQKKLQRHMQDPKHHPPVSWWPFGAAHDMKSSSQMDDGDERPAKRVEMCDIQLHRTSALKRPWSEEDELSDEDEVCW